MKIDALYLAKSAKELGVVANSLETVIRLTEALRYINSDIQLRSQLALKGGTALNLLFSNLPRLSVDLDFDYAINDSKEKMLKERQVIKKKLLSYFSDQGYQLSRQSQYSYALDSFIFFYQAVNGNRDKIKIEINYLMRSHLLPLEKRKLALGFIQEPFDVLTVGKLELFAGKFCALIMREQIRDLYDCDSIIRLQLIESIEVSLFSNLLVYYRFLQGDKFNKPMNIKNKFTQRDHVRDLLPVIKKHDSFRLNIALELVSSFLDILTNLTPQKKLFIKGIHQNIFDFSLLFDDKLTIDLATNHPTVTWQRQKEK